MKSVGKRVTRMGRLVRLAGRGVVSMRVSFSKGIVERSELGRSMGEHPTMMWRRCEFDV